jgi:hypothetical protein
MYTEIIEKEDKLKEIISKNTPPARGELEGGLDFMLDELGGKIDLYRFDK